MIVNTHKRVVDKIGIFAAHDRWLWYVCNKKYNITRKAVLGLIYSDLHMKTHVAVIKTNWNKHQWPIQTGMHREQRRYVSTTHADIEEWFQLQLHLSNRISHKTTQYNVPSLIVRSHGTNVTEAENFTNKSCRVGTIRPKSVVWCNCASKIPYIT